MDDWREDLLYTMDDTYGYCFKKIVFKSSEKNDHEHCSICFAKISDNSKLTEAEGYYCVKTGDWICSVCMNDFKNRFEWKVEM